MQRYVRMLGTPIVLLILLGILGYGAVWGYHNVLAPIPTPGPSPCATQKVGSALKSSQVTVKVLNGGKTVGLAAQVAAQLSQAGFTISGTGNADNGVPVTTIIGAKATDPEVKLVYKFFRNARIKADGRVDHSVDVVVGNTFGGMNANAPRSIAVPGGQVCLPSPTATPGS